MNAEMWITRTRSPPPHVDTAFGGVAVSAPVGVLDMAHRVPDATARGANSLCGAALLVVLSADCAFLATVAAVAVVGTAGTVARLPSKMSVRAMYAITVRFL